MPDPLTQAGDAEVTTTIHSYRGLGEDLAATATTVAEPSGTTSIDTDYASAVGKTLAQKVTTTTPAGQTDVATTLVGTGPHADVTYLSDLNGAVVGTKSLDPWGALRSRTGADSYLGFQGDPTDKDTTLVDMGARHYLPELGRFLTQDPLRGEAGAPLSQNPYIYGADDPISLWDPTGMYVQGSEQGSRGYGSRSERKEIQDHNVISTVPSRSVARRMTILQGSIDPTSWYFDLYAFLTHGPSNYAWFDMLASQSVGGNTGWGCPNVFDDPSNGCWGGGTARNIATRTGHVARFVSNSPRIAIAMAVTKTFGGSCDFEYGATVVCYDLDSWLDGPGRRAYAWGAIITSLNEIEFQRANEERLPDHETNHTTQSAIIGPLGLPTYEIAYGAGLLYSRVATGDWFCGHPLEILAGREEGGYTDC